jgi:hypothetical protein
MNWVCFTLLGDDCPSFKDAQSYCHELKPSFVAKLINPEERMMMWALSKPSRLLLVVLLCGWCGVFAPCSMAAMAKAAGQNPNYSIVTSATGKEGYINTRGKVVIKPQFAYASRQFADNGLAAVQVKLNGKYGYINASGKVVIKPQFDYAGDFASNGLARVKINDKYGYINASGSIVITPQFWSAFDFADNGLAMVQHSITSSKRGYINASGNTVIAPQFQDAGDFASNGLASVKIKGKWGYINANGNTLIAPQFETAERFASNGLALVKLNDKHFYINASGSTLILQQFEDVDTFASNGLAVVRLNGKLGYIDASGSIVIAPQFYIAYKFYNNGLAIVTQNENGKESYINEQGDWVSDLYLPATAAEKKQQAKEEREAAIRYERERPQREAHKTSENSKRVCEAQKQTCFATCEGFRTHDGSSTVPYWGCRDKCNDIDC